MKLKSKKIGIIIKIILAITLFYFLLKKVGIKQIVQTIISMNNPLFYITLSFLIILVTYLLGAMCLYVLLTPIKKIKLLKLFKYTSLSWAMGYLVPTADIISLSYLLKKEGIDWGPGLVINFLDKAITMAVLAILTMITFIKFFSISQTTNMAIVLMALFIIMVLIISPPSRKLIRRFILRKYSMKFAGFWRVFKWYILNKKSLIALNAILTLFKLVFTAASVYVIFLSMGTNIPIYYIMIINSTILVIRLMPPPFNFLGIRETVIFSLAVLLYGKLGITSATIIGTYIILFALNYLYALLIILLIDYKQIINQTQI